VSPGTGVATCAEYRPPRRRGPPREFGWPLAMHPRRRRGALQTTTGRRSSPPPPLCPPVPQFGGPPARDPTAQRSSSTNSIAAASAAGHERQLAPPPRPQPDSPPPGEHADPSSNRRPRPRSNRAPGLGAHLVTWPASQCSTPHAAVPKSFPGRSRPGPQFAHDIDPATIARRGRGPKGTSRTKRLNLIREKTEPILVQGNE